MTRLFKSFLLVVDIKKRERVKTHDHDEGYFVMRVFLISDKILNTKLNMFMFNLRTGKKILFAQKIKNI